MKRWILLAAMLWLGGSLDGWCAAAGARYSVHVWRTADGLPSGAVVTLAQTKDGYLWVGTSQGLVRFDGTDKVLTKYDDNNTPGLNSSSIFSLFEDSTAGLWIGTRAAGISRVKDGRVLAISQDGGFTPGQSPAVCEDSTGAVWFYTADNRLTRYGQGTTNAWLLPPSKLHTVIAEAGGRIRLGTDRGEFYLETAALRAGTNAPLTEMGLTNRPDFLLGSSHGGHWRLADGRIQKWRGDQLERNLAAYPWTNAPVSSACEDQDGNLVVGTYGDGVYWFDAQGNFVHLARQEDPAADEQGLSNNSILALVVDREGNLWVGTDGGGLNRVKRSPFGVLAESEGRTVQSVFEDPDGGLWVGYNGGGTNGAVNHIKDGLLGHWGTNQDCLVRAVLVDHNKQVWAGTWGPWEETRLPWGGSLFDLQTNGFKLKYIQTKVGQTAGFQFFPSVSAIHEDRHGVIWVGTQNGLFSWDGNAWKYLTAREGLSSDDVRAIADDAAGNIWVGTENGGLNRLRDGKVAAFHEKDGLPSEHISSLYVDKDDVLWAGTTGGLAWLRDGKWSRYTSREGLVSDNLDYLVDDARGNLWLGSNRGLILVAKPALDQFARGLTNYVSCRAYGESDGLPNGECTSGSQPAACRTRDGRLWFPTINGLVYVDPAAIKPNTNPPPVVIESATVEGEPQGAQGLGAEPLQSVTLPAGREHLEIQYTSLNLGAADKARFSYQMDGFETKPVEAGSRRIAPYSKLPPGTYHFHVRACNEDGVWSVTPASLEVIVLPPFWRKPWFIVTTSLCVLVMIVGGVHYVSTQNLQRQLAGLRQQQALEKERARIARDIHDQLGASLTQVSLLGEMVESDKESPGEVEAHARQISQTARDTSRVLDEIVWTVNPSNDTLEGLVNYICKYAQEYLAVAGLRYRLDVPAQLPVAVISPEVRHNVFLAAKEAVTNVVRHAHATSAFIRLRVEASSFTLEIQDDGRGIANPAEKLAGSRNGLRNMTKRMEDIGGSFAINAAPEGGTVIRLTVPIKNS